MKVIVTTTGCVDYKGKLYFQGDEMDVPDKIAKHLLDKGACETLLAISFEEGQDAQYGIIARTPAFPDMTVPALKELLDKLKVSYNGKSRKDDLIALVEANTKEQETV